jgi:hypothetical protein
MDASGGPSLRSERGGGAGRPAQAALSTRWLRGSGRAESHGALGTPRRRHRLRVARDRSLSASRLGYDRKERFARRHRGTSSCRTSHRRGLCVSPGARFWPLALRQDWGLTGRGVQGEEALRMGLVNRLVSPGRTLDGALNLAHELAAFPQRCIRRTVRRRMSSGRFPTRKPCAMSSGGDWRSSSRGKRSPARHPSPAARAVTEPSDPGSPRDSDGGGKSR